MPLFVVCYRTRRLPPVDRHHHWLPCLSQFAMHDNDLEVCETLFHEAGVDYNRPIIRNASIAVLYEEALKYEEGTAIANSGALTTSSGAKTGRCPKDKRIVDDATYSDDVWWGRENGCGVVMVLMNSRASECEAG